MPAATLARDTALNNSESGEPEARRSATVLIVDDEPLGHKVLEAALHPLKCELLSAASGAEALELAEAFLPDVVLLDILMPEMDGIEVCRRMRASERLREVPILIVTALDDRNTRLMALSAGADDFLSKPIDHDEVRARVRTIIRLNRFGRLVEEVERSKRETERARTYARQLVFAEERERRRIARELHDQIGQQLAAIKISIQLLTSSLPEDFHREIAGIRSLVDEAIQLVREISHALRPSLLDDAGLGPALLSLATKLRATTKHEIRPSIPDPCPRFDPAIELTCYRIVQEAVTNAMRHSGGSPVDIHLEATGVEVTLTIRDHGVGFDVEGALQNAISGRSLGLLGMQERARLCGGEVTYDSAPERGTVVLARFPVMCPGTIQ